MRIRPSAGTRSPASMLTMSPGTSSLHRQLDEGAVAARLRLDDHHLLERGDARRGLALLVEAHRGVEQGQADEHDARGDLVRQEQAQDAGRQQHDLHRVLVLAEERLPARLLGGLGELVRADTWPAPGLGLGGRQAALEGDALALQRASAVERVPSHRLASAVLESRSVIGGVAPSHPRRARRGVAVGVSRAQWSRRDARQDDDRQDRQQDRAPARRT